MYFLYPLNKQFQARTKNFEFKCCFWSFYRCVSWKPTPLKKKKKKKKEKEEGGVFGRWNTQARTKRIELYG